MKSKYLLLLFFLFFSVLCCQIKDSISDKNLELKKIKNDISLLEKELKSKSQKERESLQSLENINKQNLLVSRLINNLISQENEKEIAIKEVEENTINIENSISDLKKQYSKYIVWFYKNSGISILQFIINAESFNQALVRYQYLKYISKQNQFVLERLKISKLRLNELHTLLENQRREKELLANQKLNEQKELKRIEDDKKQLITVLKRDQKLIAQEIAAKRQAEIVIKNLIAKLIEQERQARIKKLENKKTTEKLVQSFDYSSLQSFSLLKGKLSWPIKEGRIVRKFGENKNERLNTITLNYGIDISVNSSIPVKAVAEGVVSAIDWIPGYGSIIILTHKDDYRTVYGHITDISVKEGEKIKPGTSLGKVNESLEGKILHFEIWNERNYQNPELWLAKK